MSGKYALIIEHVYDRFNARDIDGVLALLATDVAWANGMDGGHVHGHAALREYWTRQWAIVSPQVTPIGCVDRKDGVVAVEVIQRIFDLGGNPLEGQSHGLKDKTVLHVFHIRDGMIERFDIEEADQG